MAAQKLTKHYQKPWQLIVSVCLTRQRMLTKELSDIEQRYAKMVEVLELEKSVLNDYEIRKIDLETTVRTTKSSKMTEKDEELMTEASRKLASMQDQEEIWNADVANINVASKSSEQDKDTKSILRLMDDALHMVIRDEQLLNESLTVLPYTTLNQGESLRQASERLLSTYGVQNSQIMYHSNAPAGVVKIRFKESEERGQLYQGAKVFFTKVHVTSPDNFSTGSNENDSPDWLSMNEIETDSQCDYFERIKKFV